MAQNTEIKARIAPDQFDTLRQRAAEIATAGPVLLEQVDTFFNSRTGRLKLREFTDATAELIHYERPDREGPKISSYVRSDCPAADSMKEALNGSNGILGIVKKRREVFFVGQTRIHLDQVEGLGTFLELEVVLGDQDTKEMGESTAGEIMKQLNVDQSQLVSGAYFDLLAQSANGTN